MGTFRFLLALSVALGHFGTISGYYMINGRMAVQCFYMVSGFLISLVLSHKYDPSTPEGRWLFYTNRALRIFVPYWSFCLIILIAYAVIYLVFGTRFGVIAAFSQYWPEMTLPTRIYLLLSNILIVTQEWSMWLAYQSGAIVPVLNSDPYALHLGNFEVIPQAWSVSLELMFYAIAPFLIRRHWLVLVTIIVATYLLRSGATAYGFDGSGFAYRFFPFEIGLFLAGALSHRAYAYLESRGLASFPLSLAISALLIGVVLVQQFIDSLDNHKFYLLVAVGLPALFYVFRRSRFDSWLGELSYPIYLAHLFVGQAVTTLVIGPVENRNWIVIPAVGITILLAIAYVRWIDAPFERWRQRRATTRNQKPAPATSYPGLDIALAGRSAPV